MSTRENESKGQSETERYETERWLYEAVARVDNVARSAAIDRQQQLTKPSGSLGLLETVAVDFSGWQGTVSPRLNHYAVCVFAADHGIVAEGVSAFPQSVTVEMVQNIVTGGAAISVLAQQWNASFKVINLGTVSPLPRALNQHPMVHDYALANGTGNICHEHAMTKAVLLSALAVGAREVIQQGDIQLFIGGEMGIGNTSVSAAVASSLLDLPPTDTVGRGTGVSDTELARKQRAVATALMLHERFCTTPLETLRRLGGMEIAALTGAYITAAQCGIPSLVDGFICTTAALLACRINPGVRNWLLFAHYSAEAGHHHLLTALEATPLLNLNLRLGEASGAALAIPLIQSALNLHNSMATFAEANVSNND